LFYSLPPPSGLTLTKIPHTPEDFPEVPPDAESQWLVDCVNLFREPHVFLISDEVNAPELQLSTKIIDLR
jgi:hypothetical protein